ncbi:MAG: SRPBCC domain-containing protein [Thermoplasmata archaeon]
MPVKNLKQSVTLRAKPKEVYELLIDPRKHAQFTGATAKIDARPGGRFTHYDASLEGFVVHLETNARIVLAWRSTGWPRGQYSIADFALNPTPSGTRLEFSQYGIPAYDFEEIRDGWRTYYWKPLKQYLEG